MRDWDGELEQACERSVAGVCDPGASADQARSAWQSLLKLIAPHIEGWAAGSWLLRRWRLASEDDARTVMVRVIARLEADGHANLRRYLERQQPVSESDGEQLEVVERITRLTAGSDDSDQTDAPASTPFRAWLLTLVRYVATDYVRFRMGWSRDSSKRAVNTDADRLSDGPEAGARPPMTDFLTVKALLTEIEEHTAAFPADMREALERWTRDESYDQIATAMDLADPGSARKLVRAALARLRDRFRERWSGFLD